MNLAGVAKEKVGEQGERPSLFCEGREITNLEMQRAFRKLARVLKDLAVKRGDRVILQMQGKLKHFGGAAGAEFQRG